jgi:hypothetical protein
VCCGCHRKVKVHQDPYARVSLSIGIFVASSPHPQQSLSPRSMAQTSSPATGSSCKIFVPTGPLIVKRLVGPVEVSLSAPGSTTMRLLA